MTEVLTYDHERPLIECILATPDILKVMQYQDWLRAANIDSIRQTIYDDNVNPVDYRLWVPYWSITTANVVFRINKNKGEQK